MKYITNTKLLLIRQMMGMQYVCVYLKCLRRRKEKKRRKREGEGEMRKGEGEERKGEGGGGGEERGGGREGEGRKEEKGGRKEEKGGEERGGGRGRGGRTKSRKTAPHCLLLRLRFSWWFSGSCFILLWLVLGLGLCSRSCLRGSRISGETVMG